MKTVRIILFFLASSISWTQTLIDTTYQIELTTTASPAISLFRSPRVPGTVNNASLGHGVFVRGMWHPGRLLSVGFITGYLVIAEDELSTTNFNYRAHLAAIPMQVAISMQKHHVEIGMGMGPYMMLSTIEGSNAASTRGRRLELGLTFFGSYVFVLNDIVTIGPELRILYLRYRGILSLMPSFSIRIDALRY